MNRIILDTTDPVKRLGMGCWAIGGPLYMGDMPQGYHGADDTESRATLRAALDAGITLFDTAQVYGAGHSETLIGEVFGNRDDVTIISKCGVAFDPERRQMIGPDVSPAAIVKGIEGSLRRLQRDRVDILLLHVNTATVDEAERVFDVCEDLLASGKIGSFGWSCDFYSKVGKMRPREGFIAVEHALNVLLDAPTLLKLTAERGLYSLLRSPLAMGLLSGRFRGDETLPADDVRSNTMNWMDYFKDGRVEPGALRQVDAVRELLQSNGRTLAQGALAWTLARADHTFPLVGCRTVRQVQENYGAIDKGPLDASVMTEIESLIDRPADSERER